MEFFFRDRSGHLAQKEARTCEFYWLWRRRDPLNFGTNDIGQVRLWQQIWNLRVLFVIMAALRFMIVKSDRAVSPRP